MKQIIPLLLAVALSGCFSTRTIEPPAPEMVDDVDVRPNAIAKVQIAEDVELTLPLMPGYPQDALLFQTLVGRYDGRTRAFQATLSLSPDRVEVVLLAPSGPRVMQLTWTEQGIEETCSNLAPEDLNGLNILADIFLSTWPKQSVIDALPDNAVLLTGDGNREIWSGKQRLIDLEDGGVDEQGRKHARLTHVQRGYVLDIISEDLNAE